MMVTANGENVIRIDFRDVQVGDRLRFLTKDNGFGGTGDTIERAGLVVAKTDKTVRIASESRHDLWTTAVLRRADWNARAPRKVA